MGRVRSITVGAERETTHGWLYEVTLTFDDGTVSEHSFGLSWVDYEYWSGGDKPPSHVLERLIEAAFAIDATLELGAEVDASTLRRQITDLDQAVQSRL